MDDRLGEAVERLSEAEFERLCDAEMAKVDAMMAQLRAAVDEDRWPRELYRGDLGPHRSVRFARPPKGRPCRCLGTYGMQSNHWRSAGAVGRNEVMRVFNTRFRSRSDRNQYLMPRTKKWHKRGRVWLRSMNRIAFEMRWRCGRMARACQRWRLDCRRAPSLFKSPMPVFPVSQRGMARFARRRPDLPSALNEGSIPRRQAASGGSVAVGARKRLVFSHCRTIAGIVSDHGDKRRLAATVEQAGSNATRAAAGSGDSRGRKE